MNSRKNEDLNLVLEAAGLLVAVISLLLTLGVGGYVIVGALCLAAGVAIDRLVLKRFSGRPG